MVEQNGPRPWSRRLALVAGCGLLVAGVLAGAAVRLSATGAADPPGAGGGGKAAGDAGDRGRTQGLVRVREVAWVGARLEGTDRRRLVLTFVGGGPPGAPVSRCAPDYQGTAAVSGATVTVTVHELAPPSASQVFCTDVGYERSVEVDLPEPLRGRQVVDGADGRAKPVIDAATLRQPAYLPAGYHFVGQRVGCGPGQDCALDQREWRRGDSEDTLVLEQGDPDLARLDLAYRPVVLARTTVRGVPAVAHRSEGFEDLVCLAWTEAGTGTRLCSRGPVKAPLPVAELVRVAESLR